MRSLALCERIVLVACFVSLVSSFFVGIENPTPPSSLYGGIEARADSITSGVSCRISGRCTACSGSQAQSCGRSTKRSILLGDAADGYAPYLDDIHNATDVHNLQKRVLQSVDQSDLEGYLVSKSEGRNAINLLPEDSAGNDLSFTVQKRFADNMQNGIVIGNGGAGLTGCSCLAIVSRRAVYMGHFWQTLAFDDTPGVNFQQNLVNLIKGQTPLYQAEGDALDVTLFNAADDNTYAFWFTPRDPTRVTPGAEQNNLWYPQQMQQVGTLIQGLLPNLKAFISYGYITDDEVEDTPWGRLAMFEYDSNADGAGNGNWRLFFEETVSDGIGRQQTVVGVNKPQ